MRLCTFLIVFLLSLGIAANAQQTNRSDLEKRRQSLLNEIANTQSQLAETKKDKKATLGQLNALMAKLETRQRLINEINDEMNKINGNINLSAAQIQELKSNLKILQSTYAQSIRYAYKHRVNQNMMAFLFSAKDFNDAIRRMQYLRKYRDYRKEQAEKIRITQGKLASQINVLNTQKNEKGKLLQDQTVQKNEIQNETQQTKEVVTELKGREKELMAQIQQNQRTARKIEASIKEQIRKEIEIARKKALEEAKRQAAEDALARKRATDADAARRRAQADAAARGQNDNSYQAGGQTVTLNTGSSNNSDNTGNNRNTTNNNTTAKPSNKNTPPRTSVVATENKSSYVSTLTPDLQNLSNSFAASKGRLPWPVEKGFVSGAYGRHPNKLFPQVMEENNGLDITTNEGAPVRSVFEGTVNRVVNIDGTTTVMISHGDYLTVYANLSGASVRMGQKVTARQPIGRAGKNDEGDYIVNFQVWKIGSGHPVNPADWIAR